MFESSTRREKRSIRARSVEEARTAHFEFEYSIDQALLFAPLQELAVKALQLPQFSDATERLLITARLPSTGEGGSGEETDQIVLGGDAQLRNALLSTKPGDELEIVVSRRRKSVGAQLSAKKSIMVNVTLLLGDGGAEAGKKKGDAPASVAAETASLRFTWVGASAPLGSNIGANERNELAAGMLDTLKDELLDALDHSFGTESGAFALHFKLDGEWVPIAGDRVVFDVLSTLAAAGSTAVEARLSQSPPKPPTTRYRVRCVFEGTTRSTTDDIEIADDAETGVLALLVATCKALWGAVDGAASSSNAAPTPAASLTAADQVTLFNAVPPTDFAASALANEAAALAVVDAARRSLDKQLSLRMERGSVLPQQQKMVGPTHVHTLYYDNEHQRFEQEAEFDFAWPAHGNGALAALGEKVRALLHLTVPFDMFLGADARGEIPPQHVKTDAHVASFLRNAPAHTQLFCIKSSLDAGNSATLLAADSAVAAGTGGPLPIGRASYIRALVEDWRQILPRSNRSATTCSGAAGPPLLAATAEEERAEEARRQQPVRITAEAMRPVVMTWHYTWELKRRELQLQDAFEDWVAGSPSNGGEPSLAVEELFSVLMRWTGYLVEEEVADFARHGQSMVDYLTEISSEARCMRLSAKVFASLRQGDNRVEAALVVRALAASGTVARPEAEQVVAQYGARIEQWELDEILTYFFLDDSAAFARLLAATAALRTTPDYSQHDTQMRAVREKRLRSELRHALDGVVPAHLLRFAKEHYGIGPSQVPPAYQELAWCVAALLRHGSASLFLGNAARDEFDTPKMRAWKWLVGECTLEASAADLLAALRTTGLSYCSDDKLQEVGVAVYNDAIDARLLHTKAGAFFSSLAQWCYVLQDLTFLVRGLQLRVSAAAAAASAREEEEVLKQKQQVAAAAATTPSSPEKSVNAEEAPVATSPVAAAATAATESEARSTSPGRVRYSPPRATVALRRPQPPAAGSPMRSIGGAGAVSARSAANTTRAVIPAGSAAATTAAGFGLTPRRPEQDLAALLREQKEEHLIREFGGATGAGNAASAGGDGAAGAGAAERSLPRNKNNAEFALITIKGAAGLVKHPMLHSVDSYVVAYNSAGAVVHQTAVVEGTTSPRFPAQSRFVVPLAPRGAGSSSSSSDLGSVVFHVLTESNVAGFLGEAALKLAEATVGGTRDMVLRIKVRRGETDELLLEHAQDLGHLTVEVVPLRQPLFLPRGEPGFVVSGTIHGARSLPAPQDKNDARRDLYVQLIDCNGCPAGRTEAAANRAKPDGSGAVNPVWAGLAAEFVVPLENVLPPNNNNNNNGGGGGLRFQLVDEDLRGGRVFGSAVLLPGALLEAGEAGGEPCKHSLKISPDAVTGHVLQLPQDCALSVTARVLGPLPDDLAHRKRQEEARRLAQQRAEDIAEDKRRRDEADAERTRDNEAYIQAAEREAEKQRAAHAAGVRAQAAEREAREHKQREAEAQAKAKMVALSAAAEEEQQESGARRKQVQGAAAAATEAERARMAAIDREMQASLKEAEMKERIRKQLEEEEAARKRHDAEQQQQQQRDKLAAAAAASEQQRQQQAAAAEEPKTQQEVAEAQAKAEMRRLQAQQAAEERAQRNAAARALVEGEEAEARRALEPEYEQWIVGADKQRAQGRRDVEEAARRKQDAARVAAEAEKRRLEAEAAADIPATKDAAAPAQEEEEL